MTNSKLNELEAKWRYQNTICKALEAENAPDKYITKAKKQRLLIKDQIASMQKSISQNG